MTWERYYSELKQMPNWLKEPVSFVVEALPALRKSGAGFFLDLGCGLGRNAIHLATRGLDVVGADVSRSALWKTKSRSEIEGVASLTVLRASMTHLPFVDSTFDAVVSVSVIHHAKRRAIAGALCEIHRVLKDGGWFLANLLSVEDYRKGSGPEIESKTFRVAEDFKEQQFEEVHHFFSSEEVQTLLADFEKLQIEPIQSGNGEHVHKYWKVTAKK